MWPVKARRQYDLYVFGGALYLTHPSMFKRIPFDFLSHTAIHGQEFRINS